MELSGQHILVTGGSRGIGAAISRQLMEAGARVAVHFNQNQDAALRLIAAYPESGSVALGANLEDPDQVISLFKASLGELGHLDSLVVNAGVFLPHSTSSDPGSWWETWRKTIAINLDAAGLLTRYALDHFMAGKGGRILYIGSRAAFRGETGEYLAYAASKGGITSLARSVARSFGKHNIKAFTLAPGFTRTEMAEAFIRERGEAAVLNEIALTELTRPEDIAPLAAFICSGRMDHATGTTIDINAGSYMH